MPEPPHPPPSSLTFLSAGLFLTNLALIPLFAVQHYSLSRTCFPQGIPALAVGLRHAPGGSVRASDCVCTETPADPTATDWAPTPSLLCYRTDNVIKLCKFQF